MGSYREARAAPDRTGVCTWATEPRPLSSGLTARPWGPISEADLCTPSPTLTSILGILGVERERLTHFLQKLTGQSRSGPQSSAQARQQTTRREVK